MPTLPKFRQFAPQNESQRRALATVNDAAIVRTQSVIQSFRRSGTVKDLNGRQVTLQATDTRALLDLTRFKFNASQGHYLNASGGVVPDASVKAATESIIGNTLARVQELNRALGADEITATQWHSSMTDYIVDSEIGQTALARGGYKGLVSEEVRARTSERIFNQLNGTPGWKEGVSQKGEFPGLYRFAQDIQNGRYGTTQPNNALNVRALQYPQAARISYEDEFASLKRENGFDEVCRILSAAAHCGSCAEEAARGYVPESEATDIGDDDCGPGCQCVTVWRRAGEETGPEVQKAIERAKDAHARNLEAKGEEGDDE